MSINISIPIEENNKDVIKQLKTKISNVRKTIIMTVKINLKLFSADFILIDRVHIQLVNY